MLLFCFVFVLLTRCYLERPTVYIITTHENRPRVLRYVHSTRIVMLAVSVLWILQAMKYMQWLKNERSGKNLTVEVIDESSSGLESNVRYYEGRSNK